MEVHKIYPVYRPSVRVGNWFEDICLEEHEIREFLKKRNCSELLIQKTRTLFVNFHKEVTLERPCNYLHYGAVIQIVTCMRLCGYSKHVIPALSAVITEKCVRHSRKVSEFCEVSLAASAHPCMRNCFRITRFGLKDKTGEPLNYGSRFSLECIDAEENPLMLFATQKTPGLLATATATFFSSKRGELNLPVGLVVGKETGTGKLTPTGSVWWRCYHADPKKRFETEGQPVPPNTPVIIKHVTTNRRLSAEPIVVTTLFGPEALVSVQDYTDIFRREQPRTLWVLTTAQKT